MLDVARGGLRPFTSDAAIEVDPVWSHDGRNILFSSNRNGVFDIYQKSATGVGGEDLVLTTPQNKGFSDLSPDDRFVLFRSRGKETGFDIWAVPMSGANASPEGRSHQ